MASDTPANRPRGRPRKPVMDPKGIPKRRRGRPSITMADQKNFIGLALAFRLLKKIDPGASDESVFEYIREQGTGDIPIRTIRRNCAIGNRLLEPYEALIGRFEGMNMDLQGQINVIMGTIRKIWELAAEKADDRREIEEILEEIPISLKIGKLLKNL